MAAYFRVHDYYGTDENLTDPNNPYDLDPVADVITLPAGQFYANVELTSGGAKTLANPTTKVEGQFYVVRILIGTGGTGATLSFGTDWVDTGGTAFDSSAVGDANVIAGPCIGGKIYISKYVKSAA
jgi:hypothetical protein